VKSGGVTKKSTSREKTKSTTASKLKTTQKSAKPVKISVVSKTAETDKMIVEVRYEPSCLKATRTIFCR